MENGEQPITSQPPAENLMADVNSSFENCSQSWEESQNAQPYVYASRLLQSAVNQFQAERMAEDTENQRDGEVEAANEHQEVLPSASDIDLVPLTDGQPSAENVVKDAQSKSENKSQNSATSKNEKRFIAKNYACNICNKKFERAFNLKLHMGYHSGERPFKCDVCTLSFPNSYALKKHAITHSSDRPFKCDVCLKAFYFKTHLQDHMRIHTGEKPFTCEVCHRSFTQSSTYHKHRRLHFIKNEEEEVNCKSDLSDTSVSHSIHIKKEMEDIPDESNLDSSISDSLHSKNEGEVDPDKSDLDDANVSQTSKLSQPAKTFLAEAPYKCAICHSCFAKPSILKDHMNIHIGDRPYSCEVCGKTFTQSSTLFKHRQLHTNAARRFQCDVCERSFACTSALEIHMRTHTGERPFKCEVCPKAFRTLRHLNLHMRTHTGAKPYACDVCGRAFAQTSTLNKHRKLHIGVKEIPKRYKCNLCDASFSYVFALNEHTKTHLEEKTNQSDVCSMTFSISSQLNHHMETNRENGEDFTPSSHFNQDKKTVKGKEGDTKPKSFSCDICSKSFSQASYLNRHVKRHKAEKPYRCNVCQKSFYLMHHWKDHMKKHTGQTNYSCNICHETFVRAFHLTKHMRVHQGETPFKCDICSRTFFLKHHLKNHMRIAHPDHKPSDSYETLAGDYPFEEQNKAEMEERPFASDVSQNSSSFPCTENYDLADKKEMPNGEDETLTVTVQVKEEIYDEEYYLHSGTFFFSFHTLLFHFWRILGVDPGAH